MPHSEDEIRAYTIGELKRLSSPIVIADYDPVWPYVFRREAERISGALGSKAIRIEHAGSTSVPALAAKPVIDIVLAVADVPPLKMPRYPTWRLRAIRRLFRESEPWQHRMLKGPGADINLYVYSAAARTSTACSMFRDWLRCHADDRALYARTKLALAAKQWKYIQNYADAKTAVIDEIVARAERYHEELRAAST